MKLLGSLRKYLGYAIWTIGLLLFLPPLILTCMICRCVMPPKDFRELTDWPVL